MSISHQQYHDPTQESLGELPAVASVGSRRDILMLASALFAGGVVPIGWSYAQELSPQTLTVDSTRTLFRVRMEMDAEGNVNVPSNPLVSRKSARTLPLKSEAVFDYEERWIHSDPSHASVPALAAERYFHEAASQGEVNRTPIVRTLRPTVKSTVVRRDSLPEVTYLQDDYLTHDEIDLLRFPISSLAIDCLLPQDAVVKGDQYIVDSSSLVSLLNLSSVDASEVKGEVVALSVEEARIQLRGELDGSIDGVPTKVRVVGKLTFDRTVGVSTWLAIAVHETREISRAEPGFDVASTIKILRKPIDQPIALSTQSTQLDLSSPIPPEHLYVELRSESMGLAGLVDRRWRMMSDKPGFAMMRMIDNDRSIAQCDFRKLSSLRAGKKWSMAEFQQDVRKTLGEQWRDFVATEEHESETGLWVMTLVAQGAVEDVPIQWVIQHYSDDQGRRMLATFTMEQSAAETFAGADVQLATTLKWLDRAATATQEVAGGNTDSGDSGDASDRIGSKPIPSASDRK